MMQVTKVMQVTKKKKRRPAKAKPAEATSYISNDEVEETDSDIEDVKKKRRGLTSFAFNNQVKFVNFISLKEFFEVSKWWFGSSKLGVRFFLAFFLSY